MRGRLIGALAAGAALVASAVLSAPAGAEADTWTVTPGGAFHGVAGETVLTIEESGVQLFCVSASVDGTAKSGTGLTNPLADIPATPGIQFNDCQGPLGLTFTVKHVNTWHLVGDSYDGADVTTGRITDITADITGPGCTAQVTGSVNGTYTNSTDKLKVLPDFTLTISFVDPNANCLGLIEQGQHASFDGEFAVTPNLTITSP